jgi:glycosyltransferase involved in cell wall biosynthesis
VQTQDPVRGDMTAASLLVDIIIPAFNEGENLCRLLPEIESSILPNNLELQSILVVSDASTDRTDELVRIMAEHDQRIHLIRNEERGGKNACLNLALRASEADIIIILDADIGLHDEHVLSHMIGPILLYGCHLVGSNVVPVRTRRISLAQMARIFDWLIEDRCRRVKPRSYYSCYGRAMSLTRQCLRTAVALIPSDQADDLYIYFSTKTKGLKFHYSEHAVVVFSAATSIRDYAKQYTRYWHYKTNAAAIFGDAQIDSDLSIPSIRSFIARTIITHPLLASAWFVVRLATAVYQRLPVPTEYDSGLYYTKSVPVTRHNGVGWRSTCRKLSNGSNR